MRAQSPEDFVASPQPFFEFLSSVSWRNLAQKSILKLELYLSISFRPFYRINTEESLADPRQR